MKTIYIIFRKGSQVSRYENNPIKINAFQKQCKWPLNTTKAEQRLLLPITNSLFLDSKAVWIRLTDENYPRTALWLPKIYRKRAICERVHQVLGTMMRTAELDMADSVHPADIDSFIDNAVWAIRSTYHTVLKASPGAAIFGRDMLFDIPFVADWYKIGGTKVLFELLNQIPNLVYLEEYIQLILP